MKTIEPIIQTINSQLNLLEQLGYPAYSATEELIERLQEIQNKCRRKLFRSCCEELEDMECPNGIQDIIDVCKRKGITLFPYNKVRISSNAAINNRRDELPDDWGGVLYSVYMTVDTDGIMGGSLGYTNFKD